MWEIRQINREKIKTAFVEYTDQYNRQDAKVKLKDRSYLPGGITL